MNAPLRKTDTPWEFHYWTPEPWWGGQSAFVLASGPSLTQEVCDKVRGRNVIVINKSFRLARWAPVWFFTDSSIYEAFREEVAAWPGEVITMSRTAKRELNQRVKRVQGWGDPTLPAGVFPAAGAPHIRQGRSSGHTGISLAIALGATRVFMLGFDMRLVEGREHHHEGYAGPRDVDVYPRDFVPGFDGWNADALKVGVQIFNCTPGSAVTEFPFVDLDDVLREAA